MTHEEIRLRIQALVDNELPSEDIPAVLEQIENSYEFRQEYKELLVLKKRLSGEPIPEPPDAWFDRMTRSVARKTGSFVARIVFLGSYVLLIAYAIVSLLRDSATPGLVRLAVAGIVVGIIALFVVALSDRMKESKHDKYKGVIR
ncbi:MAG: hypothetical protein EA426_01255 [Spirochaetaceae bacterium]|nr:MAG: hypothetical protein EA426_01255 [Spirochaetaceae bacterium]